MPLSAAELLAELAALDDAGTTALARLREGDERGVAEMIERRERWLSALAEAPDGAASLRAADEGTTVLRDAGRRLQALDLEIVALLQARQTELARRLQRLGETRQMLQSYGGSRRRAALYVERLG